MSDTVKVNYSGIEIEYREYENDWEFTLRGRTRRSPTLAKAKEAIDKEPKPKKEFKSFSAYRMSRYSGDEFHTVEVTSYAGIPTTRWSGRTAEWWIKNKDNHREKVAQEELFVIDKANADIFEQIKDLCARRDELDETQAQLRKKLQTIRPDGSVDTSEDSK